MKKWVHVIGVCGVTTSGMAVMFKQLDWKVTGSDKGFYPPASDYLAKYEIDVQPGFKAERLTENGRHPDLVVVQGNNSQANPEYAEAIKLGLDCQPYAKVLANRVVCNNSIVVAGTYGKSTITMLLVEIFKRAGKDISYMYGAYDPDFHQNILAHNETTEFSIIEGDEYLTNLEDPESKFFKYRSKYLLISAVKWEHPDLFPTEKSYLDNFKHLAEQIPANGLIIANSADGNIVKIMSEAKLKARVIYYSTDKDTALRQPKWHLFPSKPLPSIVREWPKENPEIIPFERNVLGNFNDENFLAATAMAMELGIRKERVQEALSDFQGIKRRLEIRYRHKNLIVIDDFGSSPPKISGALNSLRAEFPEHHLQLIFEPNTGNRTPESLSTYQNCFHHADEVIFTRFTRLPKTGQTRYDEWELAVKLREGKFVDREVNIIKEDDELVTYLTNSKQPDKRIILFAGSHGFRNLIPEVIDTLKQND